MPPSTGRNSTGSRTAPAAAAQQPDVLLLACSSSSASSSKSGATTTSVKTSATCSAIAAVTGRFVGDDAAVGRHRVAGVRLAVRLGDVRADRDAARVGVLDDRDGAARRGRTRRAARRRRRRSCCRTSPCRAAARPGRARRGASAGRARPRLVRVLAVAQHRRALPGGAEPGREAGPVGGVGDDVAEPATRRRRRSVAVCANASAASRWRCGQVKPPAATAGEDVGVCAGRGDDRDARVVLGGGADHRRAADVDLLDALVRRGAGGDGVAERVEVDDDEVERLDAELGELAHVVRVSRRSARMPGVHLAGAAS